MERLEQVLIVDDEEGVRDGLRLILEPIAERVDACASAAEARLLLAERSFQLLLLDVLLPDATAVELLDEMLAGNNPMPLVVAMSGGASAEQSFELGKRGVRRFLSKPLNEEQVLQAVAQSIDSVPNPKAWARSAVGHLPVREAEQQVRDAMLNEAMARTDGNRSRAAKLLDVSRQLLQYMLGGKA